MSESEYKPTIWIKKNKSEIGLNQEPATVAYAENAGWKRKGAKKAPAKAKAPAKKG